jgi:hypothetical protein
MSNNQSGKGDKPRPYSVDPTTFESNWERTFGRKKEGKTCMYSGLPHVENYMEDNDEQPRTSNP